MRLCLSLQRGRREREFAASSHRLASPSSGSPSPSPSSANSDTNSLPGSQSQQSQLGAALNPQQLNTMSTMLQQLSFEQSMNSLFNLAALSNANNGLSPNNGSGGAGGS